MSITASETFRSRRGDAYSSREREYLVIEDTLTTLDDTDAIDAAVAASPSSIASTDGTLYRTNASIVREVSNTMMLVAVQYGEFAFNGAATSPVGTVEYEFSYQAPSIHIRQSLETVSVTSASGPWPNNFGGAIGVRKNSDGTYDIEGIDTSPGNTTNVWTFTTAAVTTAYESLVENMMGAVNSVPFRGRPAGSMRFVNCTSQNSSTDKSMIRFGFQYEPNRTGFQVGNITVPSKDGHDYLWVYHDNAEKEIVLGQKVLFPYPKAVFVERVFPRANFSMLGL